MKIDIKSLFAKENIYKWLLAVGYVLLLSPFAYSVFYSMPANDDFAWALTWWSDNRIVEMFHRVHWNYTNSFGNSGIFAIMIQVLFNPLYWFDNAGHSFGICQLIAFFIVVVPLLIVVRKFFITVGYLTDKRAADIATFLVAVMLYTSYYYSDVYNWWSGTPGYAMMMVVAVFTLVNIAKHQQTLEKSTYVAMIITGMIACTSMMYCVTIGVFYVIYVFIVHWKNGESFLKKAMPLACYIIAGVLMLIAPGNHTRMGNENAMNASVKASVIVTAVCNLLRLRASIISKPIAVLAIVLIMVIGVIAKGKKKPRILLVILGAVGVLVAGFGAVLPYVYGSSKALDSEFTGRVYFVEDYITIIGFAIAAFKLGQWIGHMVTLESICKICGAVAVLATVIALMYGQKHGYLVQLLPYDITQKSDIIKTTYYFWDDILDKIQESPEDDVVIDRTNVTWIPYVYPCGIDGDYQPTLSDDAKYGNCNQCASKYFGKKSIVVNLY